MSEDYDHKFSDFRQRQSSPVFNLSPAIRWLVGCMVLVHVLRYLLPRRFDDRLISYFGFVPERALNFSWVKGAATSDSALETLLGFLGQFYPFITHIFLHADLLHLSLNLLWLMIFGTIVSRRVGQTTADRRRFTLFFLVCGVVGALVHMLSFSQPAYELIGASGAISGLMGAAVRFIFAPPPPYRKRADDLSDILSLRVFTFSGVFVVLNLFIGFTDFSNYFSQGGAIAWQAHLGGYFAGLFLIGYVRSTTSVDTRQTAEMEMPRKRVHRQDKDL